MKLASILTACALAWSASTAANALTLTISGTAGSGQTLWTFSGYSVAGAGGFFDDDNGLSGADEWQDIGEVTDLADFENMNVTGLATVTIGLQTRNIDLVYVDTDTGSSDDIGVGVDGTGNFSFAAGDTVIWRGSLLVTGIDLTDLNNSGLPFSVQTSNYGGVSGALPLTVNIGATMAPVPLPAGLPLLAAGLGGLIALRRKRG